MSSRVIGLGLQLVVLGVAMAAGFQGGAPAPASSISAPAVIDAAAAYVQAYEGQLMSVIADETYDQRILGQAPLDKGMPRTRTTKSEIFFMLAPGGHDWMAIRDVLSVDGRPIPDRWDLREALRTLPTAEVASTFKARNSRLNLGRIVRNFNEPTLSLLVLDARHRARFTFEPLRVERKDGVALATLGFVEKAVPTLIADLDRRPVFSKGQVTVEEATGRVQKVMLSVTIGAVRMELGTVYSPNARLGMWVPTSFREHYEEGVDPGNRADAAARYENIICEARYTNFRRFETTVKIR